MKEKKDSKGEDITEAMKKLAIARIEAQVPSNLRLSIGSYGSMSKEEMIEHIKKGDEIGRKIVKSQLRFLRAQASGHLTKELISIE
ncbi:hypothetical protein HYV50_04800 [Candidatus Pacearchaeota archaeon]|nr:hypothetical protein [Candidatus Pacearchaeota archaeon]